MKVRKKATPNLVFDGHTGQLIPDTSPQASPDDIPSIVERYIGLVGKVVGGLETKHRELPEGKTLEGRDINSIVALGRTIAMLQAVEEAHLSRVGGKAVKDMPTSQLRKLLNAAPEETYE